MPLARDLPGSEVWERALDSSDEDEARPGRAPRAGEGAAPGPRGPIPEACFETSAELERYRRAYRRFRLGHWGGARGEAPEPAQAEGPWLPLTILVGEDGADAAYAALQEYRLAYRQHRLGAARGGKGEIGDIGRRLSAEACRLLPASQLAGLRRHLRARSELGAGLEASPWPGSWHLHVGAGRLGLGLVLPAIVESGRRFALVQRNSDTWAAAAAAGRVEVRVNGLAVASLRVAVSAEDVEEALAEGEQALLVLSEKPEALRALALRAESCSCAVGGKALVAALAPVLRALEAAAVERRERTLPPLYCCENDHEAVAELARAASEGLELVPVLVDRVCSGRELRGDGSVDVFAEPYRGDLVVPPAGRPGRGALPFAGEAVRLPSTVEGTELLHRRKILTVNGTHTTLAFLTLAEREPGTVGPPLASHELLAFDAAAAAEEGPGQGGPGRACWVWAVARQLMLLDEFPEDVLRHTLCGAGEAPLDGAGVCAELLRGA